MISIHIAPLHFLYLLGLNVITQTVKFGIYSSDSLLGWIFGVKWNVLALNIYIWWLMEKHLVFSSLSSPISSSPLPVSATALILHSHLLLRPHWLQGRVAELSCLWNVRSLIFRKWNLDSMSCCASGICMCVFVCACMCTSEHVRPHVYLT